MKTYIYLLLSVLFVLSCSQTENTPTVGIADNENFLTGKVVYENGTLVKNSSIYLYRVDSSLALSKLLTTTHAIDSVISKDGKFSFLLNDEGIYSLKAFINGSLIAEKSKFEYTLNADFTLNVIQSTVLDSGGNDATVEDTLVITPIDTSKIDTSLITNLDSITVYDTLKVLKIDSNSVDIQTIHLNYLHTKITFINLTSLLSGKQPKTIYIDTTKYLSNLAFNGDDILFSYGKSIVIADSLKEDFKYKSENIEMLFVDSIVETTLPSSPIGNEIFTVDALPPGTIYRTDTLNIYTFENKKIETILKIIIDVVPDESGNNIWPESSFDDFDNSNNPHWQTNFTEAYSDYYNTNENYYYNKYDNKVGLPYGVWTAFDDSKFGGNSTAIPDYITDSLFTAGLETNGYDNNCLHLNITLGNSLGDNGTPYYGIKANFTNSTSSFNLTDATITFFAKGKGEMYLMFETTATNDYEWGDMVAPFTLTNEWESYTISSEDINVDEWSPAYFEVSWDNHASNSVIALGFKTNLTKTYAGDTVDFWVDEISINWY